MKKYSEKLKDPRWQKKRLEVFERANWKCEFCESADITLHVHHGAYLKNTEPWEYPNESLHCLCESCHEIAERYKADITNWLLTAKIEDLQRLAEDILPDFEKVWRAYLDCEYPE